MFEPLDLTNTTRRRGLGLGLAVGVMVKLDRGVGEQLGMEVVEWRRGVLPVARPGESGS